MFFPFVLLILAMVLTVGSGEHQVRGLAAGRGFGINDNNDQDIQNLVTMLKRNGFTEEGELQEALKVLRPEKFGASSSSAARQKRQAPSAAELPANAQPALLAPPLDASNNNNLLNQHAPIAPHLEKEGSKHHHHHNNEDGVIAHHGAVLPDGPLPNKLGALALSPPSVPTASASEQLPPIGPPSAAALASSNTNVQPEIAEPAAEKESEGLIEGVVHKVTSIFSASE